MRSPSFINKAKIIKTNETLNPKSSRAIGLSEKASSLYFSGINSALDINNIPFLIFLLLINPSSSKVSSN